MIHYMRTTIKFEQSVFAGPVPLIAVQVIPSQAIPPAQQAAAVPVPGNRSANDRIADLERRLMVLISTAGGNSVANYQSLQQSNPNIPMPMPPPPDVVMKNGEVII